jgi:hypothetical protein
MLIAPQEICISYSDRTKDTINRIKLAPKTHSPTTTFPRNTANIDREQAMKLNTPNSCIALIKKFDASDCRFAAVQGPLAAPALSHEAAG